MALRVSRVNLYGDATTPGSGDLINGDFESGMRRQYGAPEEVYSDPGFEHRQGMVNTYEVRTPGNETTLNLMIFCLPA